MAGIGRPGGVWQTSQELLSYLEGCLESQPGLWMEGKGELLIAYRDGIRAGPAEIRVFIDTGIALYRILLRQVES